MKKMLAFLILAFSAEANSNAIDTKEACIDSFSKKKGHVFIVSQQENCTLTVACSTRLHFDIQIMLECRNNKNFYHFHSLETENHVTSLKALKVGVIYTIAEFKNEKLIATKIMKGLPSSKKGKELKRINEKLIVFSRKDGKLYSRDLRKCVKNEAPYIYGFCVEREVAFDLDI